MQKAECRNKPTKTHPDAELKIEHNYLKENKGEEGFKEIINGGAGTVTVRVLAMVARCSIKQQN